MQMRKVNSSDDAEIKATITGSGLILRIKFET